MASQRRDSRQNQLSAAGCRGSHCTADRAAEHRIEKFSICLNPGLAKSQANTRTGGRRETSTTQRDRRKKGILWTQILCTVHDCYGGSSTLGNSARHALHHFA